MGQRTEPGFGVCVCVRVCLYIPLDSLIFGVSGPATSTFGKRRDGSNGEDFTSARALSMMLLRAGF